MLVSVPPQLAPAKLVQYLKGRSSRLLQDEFPQLKRRYWGQHLWARGYFCASVGAVDEDTIQRYIKTSSGTTLEKTSRLPRPPSLEAGSQPGTFQAASARHLPGGFSQATFGRNSTCRLSAGSRLVNLCTSSASSSWLINLMVAR
jgi:hypothetical protein